MVKIYNIVDFHILLDCANVVIYTNNCLAFTADTGGGCVTLNKFRWRHDRKLASTASCNTMACSAIFVERFFIYRLQMQLFQLLPLCK